MYWFYDGFKYLGFPLKPNGYGIQDWGWMVAKIEAKINNWCNGGLLSGGRLNLIKSILETIPMFWHTLAYTPKGILEKIRKKVSRFLWSGKNKMKRFHLSSKRL